MASHHHVWPEFDLRWSVVIGSAIGFIGAAMGSAGGVGCGGIYVPMLTLILGFDPKSAAAMSKLTSIKAMLRGIETWKKETLIMMEAEQLLEYETKSIQLSALSAVQISSLTDMDASAVKIGVETTQSSDKETTQLLKNGCNCDSKGLYNGMAVSQSYEVSLSSNIQWADLCLRAIVWIAFFVLQISKTYVRICSMEYWILNFLQVPIALSAALVQAIGLYKGNKIIASKGKDITNWRVSQLLQFCCCGVAAGAIGGTLGLGGGFILTPLFLEFGIPPQVASATSAFSMAFSSSMSVVQYYLLKRFPVPFAAYLAMVTILAAFTGQHVVSKLITLMGRASIIVFSLAATILVSAFCLGGIELLI